jgi:ArsR family transcriptional regulator, arsenate/arsenite/antimonite-responsive transcriptional repressor
VLAAGTKTRIPSNANGRVHLDAALAVDYARRLKALADETRLRILDLIASAADDLCACEIEACFELSQPTISHHMRILRDAGLVVTAKRGQWVYYRIADGALKPLRELCRRLG